MNNVIKLVLAILFFLCLADMPYGFYQFTRFAALVGFAILAYQADEQGLQTEMGRQIWNVVDVVAGIGLVISVFSNPKASGS